MDPELISTIAYTIRNSKLANKKDMFKNEYKEFAENYPMLFDMCCAPKPVDMKHLDMMIAMLKQINGNQLTNHVASVQVGQKLYDAFVKDIADADGVEVVVTTPANEGGEK